MKRGVVGGALRKKGSIGEKVVELRGGVVSKSVRSVIRERKVVEVKRREGSEGYKTNRAFGTGSSVIEGRSVRGSTESEGRGREVEKVHMGGSKKRRY